LFTGWIHFLLFMSTFGKLFSVSTFGESHCYGVGCIVEGVPPRMKLTEADIQPQLTRRRPGQSALTTARDEKDKVSILSGTEHGYTLGTPIALLVRNEDQRPGDYKHLTDIPRPSHADYTYQQKYGVRASSGGGRSSARETIGRVASGAIAEKWLRETFSTEIVAWVSSVGDIHAPKQLESDLSLTRAKVDQNAAIRCPDDECAKKMSTLITTLKAENDSVGGIVTCVCRNLPLGLGEPCFDKLEAMLAHAMLSIPATKGFEIGSGFEGTKLRGSQHNDLFVQDDQQQQQQQQAAASSSVSLPSAKYAPKLTTLTNNSGGIQGGISNGENIVFRVAFKPPATIGKAQDTCDFKGDSATLAAKGRHDPCVVPRAVPIVETMAALVLADAAMMQQARETASKQYPVIGKVAPSSHK